MRCDYIPGDLPRGLISIHAPRVRCDGEGRRCDPNKCKFEKIIFLGDADVDGLHIRTLLLKMFLVYYRPLVEAGRVYAAVPPLYSIKTDKNNNQFFTNEEDYRVIGQKVLLKSLNPLDLTDSNKVLSF